MEVPEVLELIEKLWGIWLEAKNLRPRWTDAEVRQMKKFYMVKEAKEQKLAAEIIVKKLKSGWIGFQLDETNGKMRKATQVASASGDLSASRSSWAMQRGCSTLSTVLSLSWLKQTSPNCNSDSGSQTITFGGGDAMVMEGQPECVENFSVEAVRNSVELNSRTLLMDDA